MSFRNEVTALNLPASARGRPSSTLDDTSERKLTKCNHIRFVVQKLRRISWRSVPGEPTSRYWSGELVAIAAALARDRHDCTARRVEDQFSRLFFMACIEVEHRVDWPGDGVE